MSTNMKGRIVEGILTVVCTALVIWSMNFAYTRIIEKFDEGAKRSIRIEEKLGDYIKKDEFNILLEAKLKQFKVTKDGRLIVAP